MLNKFDEQDILLRAKSFVNGYMTTLQRIAGAISYQHDTPNITDTKIVLSWVRRYGCVDIIPKFVYQEHIHNYNSHFRYMHQDEYFRTTNDHQETIKFLRMITQQMETEVLVRYENTVSWQNTLDFCQSPNCQSLPYLLLKVCNIIGEKHLCEDCTDRYSLIVNYSEPNTKKKLTKFEKERRLLTPGLRYDILSRDNFTCKICGRNADDNVKLHVDHIHPISKGGKTVQENLQTLCQDCNLGKSNKV